MSVLWLVLFFSTVGDGMTVFDVPILVDKVQREADVVYRR